METTVITDQEFVDWESRKTGHECQGTRIAIFIDGPIHDVLMRVIKEKGVTKRAYLKQTLMQQLADSRYEIDRICAECGSTYFECMYSPDYSVYECHEYIIYFFSQLVLRTSPFLYM